MQEGHGPDVHSLLKNKWSDRSALDLDKYGCRHCLLSWKKTNASIVALPMAIDAVEPSLGSVSRQATSKPVEPTSSTNNHGKAGVECQNSKKSRKKTGKPTGFTLDGLRSHAKEKYVCHVSHLLPCLH